MTSISFARIAGTSTTFAGTNAYTQAAQPTGTAGATGQEVSDFYLLTVFTKPYLDAHTLSFPSWRYSYYVWFVFIGLFIVWTVLHQLHFRFGALGAAWRSVAMRKVTLGGGSRSTGKGRKNKQDNLATSTGGHTVDNSKNNAPRGRAGWSTPTLAQLFGLAVLLVFTFLVCYIGPDYINPQECMFGGICGFHAVNGNNATDQYGGRAQRLRKRALEFVAAASGHLFHRRRLARYGWSPLTDPLLAGPNYTFDKNYWASGNRVGLIAYAFLPLSVGLALKQWPMNPFATPFFTNLHIDKTAFWHRWVGRIVWMLSTVHAGLWTKQLFIDLDPFNEPTWYCAWKWHRLVAGGVSYIALTLMVALSFKPLRNRFYELFYYSHVLLVAVFLATIVIHYQALQGWGLLAAGLWGLERLVRFSVWTWLNHGRGLPIFGEGRIGKAQFSSRDALDTGFKVHNVEKRLSAEGQKYAAVNSPYGGGASTRLGAGATGYGDEEWSAASRSTHNLNAYDNNGAAQSRQPVYAFGPGADEASTPRAGNGAYDDPSLPHGAKRALSPLGTARTLTSDPMGARVQTDGTSHTLVAPLSLKVPRGYALAQILPGRVLKLTLHTPRHLNWKPGQHIQLTIPSVRWWQSHPYSIVNAQNMTEAAIAANTPSRDRQGSELVFLMSVRKGFTRRLLKSILQKRRRLVGTSSESYQGSNGQQSSHSMPQGVLIRAQTYLPAGSAARAHWDDYSTVVLIAAGTGVTYTVSVLQHLCHMMAAKDAALRGEGPAGISSKKRSKPTNVARVRFIWVFREYAHLAWIAPALRRCLDIADPSRLRIDLYVTRDAKRTLQTTTMGGMQTPMSAFTPGLGNESHGDLFRPPAPGFARGQHGRSDSADSSVSDLSQTVVDPSEWTHTNKGYGQQPSGSQSAAQAGEESEEMADFSVTDMILFDGEDEHPTFEDEEMSRNIRKEGKLRRGLSRKKKSLRQPQFLAPSNANNALHAAAFPDQGDLSADESPAPTPARSHAYPPVPNTPRRGSYQSYNKEYDDGTDKESFLAGGATTPAGMRRQSAANVHLLNDDEIGQFDLSNQDKEDLSVIAELARSGRPDIPGILDSEIERSEGKVVVASCGPLSLNNLIRNMVAKRISPARVARGDQRGNIELITEDFFY